MAITESLVRSALATTAKLQKGEKKSTRTTGNTSRKKEMRMRLQDVPIDMTTEKSRRKQPLYMPRGEYKGWRIERIPSDYLKYVAENWDEDTEANQRLVKACDDEWQWREHYWCHISKEDAVK